jgi:4-hydroxy-tetrahydrodipicolinate reductase
VSLHAAVVGYGRMGRSVAEIWEERGHKVAATLSRGGDLSAAAGAELAFEFTHPEAAEAHLRQLIEMGVPTVCGTTGWDPAPVATLAEKRQVPLMVAPNFSVGIAVLRGLVGEAGHRFAAFPSFEAGIVERHHSRKVDSPSGTARMLARVLMGGEEGAEPPVAALRQGGQPGEHRVIFDGAEEEVEILHRARSRRAFALGAVLAGEWLVATHPSGFVTFEQFLAQRGAEIERSSS